LHELYAITKLQKRKCYNRRILDLYTFGQSKSCITKEFRGMIIRAVKTTLAGRSNESMVIVCNEGGVQRSSIDVP